MMDYGLSPAGSRSPLTSSNSSCPDPNPTPTPTPTTADDDPHVSRPPRACEYCRQHKVRCDIDLRDPSGSCGRCQKAGRDCVSSSYSRKRRKTTDSRVLDLERKVERLTSRLDGLERRSGFEGGGSGEGHEQPTGEHSSGYQIPGGSDTRTPPAVVVQPPNSSDTTQIQEDVIDRQILSIELAGRMFQHYITKLVPVFPAVVFSPDTASSDIRRQKPILFLAILSVASGEFDTKLQGKLYKELLKCFADQIIFRGTKSLELIQALTVSVLWHQPPETSGGNNLNQFIHMAAVMASDIAITKSSSSKKLPGPATDMSTKAEPLSDHFPMGAGWRLMIWGCNPDASLPECRRAFLSCYFMCSNISRLFRRQNLFQFTPYVSDCITFFETSQEPGVFPSDKCFVEWIKLSHMTEEFAPTPGDSGVIGTSEHRAQVALESFLERLAKWRQAAASVITPALDLFAQGITKHMYDLILHSENVGDEFRPLVFENLLARAQREADMVPPTKFHADTVKGCLAIVHSCLDRFLSFSPEFVRSLPGLFYIEMGYGIGLLVKMLFTAALSSDTNRILEMDEIKFSHYINSFIAFLGVVTGQGQRRSGQKLRIIMMGLKAWVDKHRQKMAEMSKLIPKGNVHLFKHSPPAVPLPTPPPPPPTQLPQQTFLPALQGEGVPLFGGFGEFAGIQEMDYGDPMVWDSFPLTEFLQLDGAADLYPSWR